ncbi:MAG: hypothetical protein M1830_005548 [Pleopsidium flavum]|nr:MAG: hypothetical protein M1830_005548 [Pleopsidium flavum]
MLGPSRYLPLLATIFLSLRAHAVTVGPRQLPANATGVQTLVSPGNVTIRYKNPGAEGICETTPCVNSYAGYIDLAPDSHTFFWFFEARNNPAEAPVTLWLNGGPGSDSLIGLFQELGPCNITRNYTTMLNPYAWNEVSNMLFISQPVGVGFSYSDEEPGTINQFTGVFQDASVAGVDGRYAVINATAIDTTDLAAMAAWHILQGFYSALPQLDSKVKSKTFNLWTESYGGHYGPSFYNYFYDQNKAIANGTVQGTQLNFDTLGIINGIIDEATQAPYYPEFAVNNTYGIKAVNDTVYNYMKFACFMPNGCLDQIDYCRQTNRTSLADYAICAEAENMCRDNVEGPYYQFSGRGVYDIRHPYRDPTPPTYFIEFLNLASTQQALGVNLNYTQDANDLIYYSFQQTGDFVYPNFITDLEMILNNGVRVSLIYGDADFIFSLTVNYTHAAQFRAAGYEPFMVNNQEYGEVRQYGNFSFLRMYEAGHEVPYYQPLASLEAFRRTLLNLDLADGLAENTVDYSTNGTAKATHTEPFVALPSSTSSSTSLAKASSTGVY